MSEVVDRLAGHFGFTPRAVARTGQVSAALLFAVGGIGVTVAPENAVPLRWSRHVRRIGSGYFRERWFSAESSLPNWRSVTGTCSSPWSCH